MVNPNIMEKTMKAYLRTLVAMASVVVFYTLAASANAQATRTWVSGVGDDVNPCSRTAPCKTFAGAISKTATNGEINCLDAGGFGAVTITKGLTIKCAPGLGSILASLTTGIIINAAGATVVIDGLDIVGAATGINGINILAATKVDVIRTQIRGFTNNGIVMGSSTGTHLFVNDSFILNNGLAVGAFGGINVAGANNIASLTNTSLLSNGNGLTGFAVRADTASSIIGLQTSVLNDSGAAITRTVAGAQTISVGPSNLVVGTCTQAGVAAACFTGTILFQ